MKFAIPAWDCPAVPVAGGAEFYPVHHIYCVGRNYAEHAREMGGDAAKEPPFFFTKAADAIVPVVPPDVGHVRYPLATKNYHHEIELVVAIGASGVCVAPERANALIYGYAVGLDMTRRDLQIEAKKQGRPWEVGKAFDCSAPIGPLHAISETGAIESGAIHLDVNGQARQDSDISKLIWNVAETIEHLSSLFELQPGDLIFSGTPEGVAKVERGDVMEGRIAKVGTLRVEVV